MQQPRPSSPVPHRAERDPELIRLVARARIGDVDAQTTLVHRYSPRVGGLVRRIITQRDEVADVTQIVFIKMIKRIRSLRDPALFEQWIFALTRNAAFDYFRRQQRRPKMVFGNLETIIAPDRGMIDEIMEAFGRALKQLKPLDQTLVQLVVEGHSYRIAADRTGLSECAVKVRLHRARPILRMHVREVIGARLRSDRRWDLPPRSCVAA